jgi:hypothetical protein
MSNNNRFNALIAEYDDNENYNNNWRTIGSHKNKDIENKIYGTSVLSKKINKKDNRNYKKMLCENVVMHGGCNYGTRCNYAHKLEEQIVDNYKKNAYDILKSENDISNIDLQKDLVLYKTFVNLGKLCENCDKNKCTGGFNCKFGACSKIYQICLKDLNYGDCVANCNYIHLTKRGIRPFYISAHQVKQPVNNTSVVTMTFQLPQGTLLSSEYFKTNNIEKRSDTYSDMLDDMDDLSDLSSEDNDNPFDNECQQSIFE